MLSSATGRLHQQRLAEAICPGARIVRFQRFVGGLSSTTYRLDLVDPTGFAQIYVVKRYSRDRLARLPHAPQREYGVLERIRSLQFRAPGPVLLDVAGDTAGSPAIVTTFLPGSPVYETDDPRPYLPQLAATLAAVHGSGPFTDGAFPYKGSTIDALGVLRPSQAALRRLPLLAEICSAMMAKALKWPLPKVGLVHGDTQLGNFLWTNGKLTGVIDWGDAALGDPAEDVANCRQSLAMFFGGDSPNEFLAHYVRERGPLPTLPFWDLFVAARGLTVLHLLRGAQFLGRETPELRRARSGAEQFAVAALRAAGAA